MGISDVFGGVKGERYRKERAYTVGASPSFFDLKPSGDDLSVSDMIMTSTTKESFSKKMNLALRYHGDADPVDFSLAIGKFTGVYNLYPSCYLTEEVKREIASMDVDPNKTRAFLNRHFNSMATYFQKAYHIHADRVQQDIAKMFDISIDSEVYQDPVCRDVGKILITTGLLFRDIDPNHFEENISYLISSGEMIQAFDKYRQDSVAPSIHK